MASKSLNHFPNTIIAYARCEDHGIDIRLMSIVIQIIRKQMPSPLAGIAVLHCIEMMHPPSSARKLHNCILKI